MKKRKIGKWNIVSLIHRGGQASVYEAFENEGTPIFALKKIETNAIKKRSRFIQEIEKHVQLSDKKASNIIPIIDHNLESLKNGNKIGFIVMPKAVTTLGNKISFTKNRIEICLEIILGILNGIKEAHEIGIIHRDIKPFNILFLDDSLREPVISDFGICFVKETPEDLRVTAINETVGAKFFMAPEQERGGFVEVDERADIYALGKLLHHMLTGRTLFRENLKEAFESEELDSDIRYKAIFDEILSLTIKFDKEDRFNSVEEFIDAVRKIKKFDLIKKDINNTKAITSESSAPIHETDYLNIYQLVLDDVINDNFKSLKLKLERYKKESNTHWQTLRNEIEKTPDKAEEYSKKLIQKNINSIFTAFAIIKFDTVELFEDLRDLINYVLNLGSGLAGYVAVNSIPHVFAGLMYMSELLWHLFILKVGNF